MDLYYLVSLDFFFFLQTLSIYLCDDVAVQSCAFLHTRFVGTASGDLCLEAGF